MFAVTLGMGALRQAFARQIFLPFVGKLSGFSEANESLTEIIKDF